MLRITLVLLLLLITPALKVSAQEHINSGLQESYTNYFSKHDSSVFLHLNKTTFLPEEQLWFAAYLYQPFTRIPDMQTTNLQVAIFGKDNKEIISKTIFVNSAKGAGYIDLTNLNPGYYTIVASTGSRGRVFQQHIQIISGTTNKSIPSPLDLQLLPEGGHLLADTENSIGFKFLDSNGRGKQIEALLLNDKRDTLQVIKSNRFGMGRFSLTPEPNKSYHIDATVGSQKVSKDLPRAKESGINLSVNRLGTNFIVSVRTNDKSMANIKDQSYELIIHNGVELQKINFSFEKDQLKKTIPLDDNILNTGINILTVFDSESNPLVERMIYKDLEKDEISISSSFIKKESDSLVLELQTENDSIAANSLSISILPKKSKSYLPENTILSWFKLKPYVRGNIEQPEYYFSNTIDRRRRLYDLDLLLLNQGWTKYNWSEVFKSHSENRDIAKGFTIQGTVNNEETEPGDKVFLKSEEAGLFEILELDEKKSFQLPQLFIMDSTKINIGVTQGKKQKIVKPSMYVRILPTEDHFKNFQASAVENLKIENTDTKLPELGDFENFIKTEVTLDTITIKSSKREKSEEIIKTNFGQLNKIDAQTRKAHTYLSSYLIMQGFQVYRNNLSVQIFSRRFGRKIEPAIQLDGINLMDNSIITELKMDDIESVYVNKTGGAVMGRTNIAGLIRINTLSGSKRNNTNENYSPNTYEFIADTGFARNKEFYAPQYRSYSDRLFEEYGVIDWKNNIILDKNGKASFKVLNTLQEEITLFIEGMTIDGKLISEQHTLEIN